MLQIETQDDADALALTVSGDIDLVTVDGFCERGLDAIAQADGRPVIIDVAAVTFIDSTGLGALVSINNAAAAAGTPLMLRAVPPRMASLLRITAIDTVIPVSEGSNPSA